LLSIPEYIAQIKIKQKRTNYQKAYDSWVAAGFPDFETHASFFQKAAEQQFCAIKDVRSRIIADNLSKAISRKKKRRILSKQDSVIKKELYKVVIGTFSYNVT